MKRPVGECHFTIEIDLRQKQLISAKKWTERDKNKMNENLFEKIMLTILTGHVLLAVLVLVVFWNACDIEVLKDENRRLNQEITAIQESLRTTVGTETILNSAE